VKASFTAAIIAAALFAGDSFAGGHGQNVQTIVRTERITGGNDCQHGQNVGQIQIDRLQTYKLQQPTQTLRIEQIQYGNAQQFQNVQRIQRIQRVQRFENVSNGGNFDVEPTGLAALLGTGGPRLRVRDGQLADVEPTGFAKFLGLGGPRIRQR